MHTHFLIIDTNLLFKYCLPILILLLFIYFIFLRLLFKKYKIDKIYFSYNDSHFYILGKASVINMSKTGMFETSKLSFHKINYIDGKPIFKTKLFRYTTKILDGFTQIYGLNEKYIFISNVARKFLVLNNQTGEIIGNRKEIEKLTPELKKFDINKCHYSYKFKTIIFIDNQGYSRILDLPSLTTKIVDIDVETEKKDELEDYFCLDDYYFTSFQLKNSEIKSIMMKSFLNDYFNRFQIGKSDRYYVLNKSFILASNKEDKFKNNIFKSVGILPDDIEKIVDTKSESYFLPKIISSCSKKTNQLSNINATLILHPNSSNDNPEDINISLVNEKSITIWSIKAKDAIIKPRFNENNKLFYIDEGKRIRLFYYNTDLNSNTMSVVLIDLISGKILNQPYLLKI